MILIVAHHYVVNSGLKELLDSSQISSQSIYLYVLGMWGKTGINCFVFITGFFMCKSKISLNKIIQLLLEIYFYQIVIGCIFILFGYETINVKTIIKILSPIHDLNNGFTSAFIVYYLIIPFLNILLNNLNCNQHKTLIVLCLFIYCLFSKIGILSLNYLSWFCVLHIIISYIRFYSIPFEKNICVWGWISSALVLLSIMSVILLKYLGKTQQIYWFVSDTNSVFALFLGFSSFMFFKNLKIRHFNIINTIAASTFGVFLIHANSNAMRQWLWCDTLQNASYFGTFFGWIHPILCVVVVFSICTLIDYLRRKMFEAPILNWITSKLEK